MDYKNFIKSLDVPPGYAAPAELRYQDIVARALSRADLLADVNGINSSLAVIQRTRGGDWPSGPISEEFDYVDLVWHELEFRENYSYSYAVTTPRISISGVATSTRWAGALRSMRTWCTTMST